MKKFIFILLLFCSCSTDRTLNRGAIVTGITFTSVAKASKFSWGQSATIGITSAIVVYTLNKIFKH